MRKFRKIFAAFILIIFVITVLSGLFNTLANFPLENYLESLELSRHPEIDELRQGVVVVNSYESGRHDSLSMRQTGTGFNIDDSGKILTNRHVIEDSQEVTISFHDGKDSFTVDEWQGSPHPGVDIAVMDLSADELPYLDMADSPKESVSDGDEVLIIGNPRGIGGLVAEGKIKGKEDMSELPHMIMEIESSIHPGHSGSPVFNEQHEVIGIIYASRELPDGTEVGLAISVGNHELLK